MNEFEKIFNEMYSAPGIATDPFSFEPVNSVEIFKWR